MNLHEYLTVLRKRWRSVLAVLVVALALAVTATQLITPRYTAVTEIYFSVPGGETVSDLAVGSTFTEQQMSSYARVATSPLVLDEVVEELGLPGDGDLLAESVTVTQPPNTVILEITVEHESPAGAAEIADSLAGVLTTTATALTPDRTDGRESVLATVLRSAKVPQSPSSPHLLFNLALATSVGLIAGVALAFLREATDTRLRSAENVAAVTDAPILGTIGFDPKGDRHQVFVRDEPHGSRSEAVRRLRTNLQFVQLAGGHDAIVVTSTLPAEGKSTTAVNLAVSLADTGAKVVLVDADLRRPSVAAYLGLENAAGLTTVLIGRAALADVLQNVAGTSLDVLASGQIPPNPSELLGSAAMSDLLARLGAEYDVVLLDSPPLLAVTDAVVLGAKVGGTLLVIDADRIHKAQLVQSLEALDRVDGHLLGIVMNKVTQQKTSAYYTYQAESDAPAPSRHAAPAARGGAAPSRRAPATAPTPRRTAARAGKERL